MRSVFLVLSLFVFYSVSFSQAKPVNLSQENLLKPKTFGKGAILHIAYDSVMVYDKIKHKESLLMMAITLKNFDGIKQQYDSCVAYASENARKLSAVTLSLSSTVNSTVDSSATVLFKTKQELNQAVDNLNSANANLKSTEDLLKKEKRKRATQKFIWAAGGLGIGVLVSALLFIPLSHK